MDEEWNLFLLFSSHHCSKVRRSLAVRELCFRTWCQPKDRIERWSHLRKERTIGPRFLICVFTSLNESDLILPLFEFFIYSASVMWHKKYSSDAAIWLG